VDIAIDDHGADDLAVALKAADGDRNVVEHAESLAVIGEGVVEAASNVEAAVVAQRLAGGQNRSACYMKKSIDKFFAIRNFQLEFLARTQGSALQLVDPELGVNEQQVAILAGRSGDKVGFSKISGLEKALTDGSVFARVKDMVADRQSCFF
jgi:hypothetical protein